jgi:hypothetical protein
MISVFCVLDLVGGAQGGEMLLKADSMLANSVTSTLYFKVFQTQTTLLFAF